MDELMILSLLEWILSNSPEADSCYYKDECGPKCTPKKEGKVEFCIYECLFNTIETIEKNTGNKPTVDDVLKKEIDAINKALRGSGRTTRELKDIVRKVKEGHDVLYIVTKDWSIPLYKKVLSKQFGLTKEELEKVHINTELSSAKIEEYNKYCTIVSHAVYECLINKLYNLI